MPSREDVKQRYLLSIIEVRRQRLRSITDNLFQSYIRHVILVYTRNPTLRFCYDTLRELDGILGQLEVEITRRGMGSHIDRLLAKARGLASQIGGEAQVIIEDLVEIIQKFY